MSTFTKLDSGIVHSTIWVQPHDVLRVWIAMLALADQHGVARTAAPALAHLCMIPLDRMREILHVLESPDEDSRSEAEEGRRILKVQGGWQLVNHAAYRNARDSDAERERKREWDRQHRPSGHARAKQSDDSPTVRQQSDESPTSPTHTEADTDTEQKQKQEHVQPSAAQGRFEEFWAAYPNKKGKKAAAETWRKRKLDAKCDELLIHVELMRATDSDWQRGYAPMGSTYLNGDRWEDVPKRPPDSGPRQLAAPGKQMQGVMALEELKNAARQRLAPGGSGDRPAEARLPLAGPHAGR